MTTKILANFAMFAWCYTSFIVPSLILNGMMCLVLHFGGNYWLWYVRNAHITPIVPAKWEPCDWSTSFLYWLLIRSDWFITQPCLPIGRNLHLITRTCLLIGWNLHLITRTSLSIGWNLHLIAQPSIPIGLPLILGCCSFVFVNCHLFRRQIQTKSNLSTLLP